VKLPKRVEKFIVIYDIASDKEEGWHSRSLRRRNKIARVLLEIGVRTQKSVYEITADGVTLERALKRVEKIAHLDRDKIYVYPLESKVAEKVLRIGKEPPTLKLLFI
jgi:CRISPR-associated protein Cas2